MVKPTQHQVNCGRLKRIQFLQEKLEVTHHQPTRDNIKNELFLLTNGMSIESAKREGNMDNKRNPYGKGMV